MTSNSAGRLSTCRRKPEEMQPMKPEEKLASVVDNHFFREHEARDLPCYDWSELGIGPRLGVGGFCNVAEICNITLNPDYDPQVGQEEASGAEATLPSAAGSGAAPREENMPESSHNPEEEEDQGHDEPGKLDSNGEYKEGMGVYGDIDADADHHDYDYVISPKAARPFMAMHCLRKGDARYALKKLRRDLSEKERHLGILDLAIEAKFLAVISHPNIIKMRGTAAADSLSPEYFIILDRLYGTLDDRMDDWSDLCRLHSGGCCGFIGRDKDMMTNLMLDRLTVAYDLATVFRYLHENNIIYRDIKPENIGFDVRGDVKVFDFGLAKVLRRKDKMKDGLYKLTGVTGSMRYMAPEVAKSEPYNLLADAFSFGTMFWQILALQVPFEDFTPRDYKEQVCEKGYRPSISSSWPVFAREIVRECWSENIQDRPDFVRIANVIRGMMNELADTTRGSIHNRTSHMMNRSGRSQRNFARTLPTQSTATRHSDHGDEQNNNGTSRSHEDGTSNKTATTAQSES